MSFFVSFSVLNLVPQEPKMSVSFLIAIWLSRTAIKSLLQWIGDVQRADIVSLLVRSYVILRSLNYWHVLGHAEFSEQEFTKLNVQQAFGIQPTLASNDASLFEPSKLIRCPDILEWIEDPEGEHRAKFARMSTKNFKEYISKQEAQYKLQSREDLMRAEKKEHRRKRREEEYGSGDRVSKKQRKSERVGSDGLDD